MFPSSPKPFSYFCVLSNSIGGEKTEFIFVELFEITI